MLWFSVWLIHSRTLSLWFTLLLSTCDSLGLRLLDLVLHGSSSVLIMIVLHPLRILTTGVMLPLIVRGGVVLIVAGPLVVPNDRDDSRGTMCAQRWTPFAPGRALLLAVMVVVKVVVQIAGLS